jgi:hypothetical protein
LRVDVAIHGRNTAVKRFSYTGPEREIQGGVWSF